MSESDRRAAVIAEACTWLGTPYHHQARLKGAGVDCAQILIAVYANTGMIDEFDTGYYPPDWMLHREEERYLGFVLERAHEVPEPQPGDIVLYKFGRCFSHAGIVIDWPQIIHSYRGLGVVYGEGDNGVFAGREHKFFSLWGDK